MGYSQFVAVSTYQKWFNEGQKVNLSKGHERTFMRVGSERLPVWSKPTEELLYYKAAKKELILAMREKCQNTQSIAACGVWGGVAALNTILGLNVMTDPCTLHLQNGLFIRTLEMEKETKTLLLLKWRSVIKCFTL